MKRIGILCAMQKEYDLLIHEFKEDGSVRCSLSGIGKVNAAIATERMIADFKPDCILSIGCAGTFVEGLEEGVTVIADRCAYHDVWCGKGYGPGQMAGLPQYFECDPQLVAAARASLPDAPVGLLCTGDQFYVSPEEDARQKRFFPEALAIDMEGTSVAHTAYLHRIPFIAVKVISDNHTCGNQRARYDRFWNEMACRSFTSIRKILQNI